MESENEEENKDTLWSDGNLNDQFYINSEHFYCKLAENLIFLMHILHALMLFNGFFTSLLQIDEMKNY